MADPAGVSMGSDSPARAPPPPEIAKRTQNPIEPDRRGTAYPLVEMGAPKPQRSRSLPKIASGSHSLPRHPPRDRLRGSDGSRQAAGMTVFVCAFFNETENSTAPTAIPGIGKAALSDPSFRATRTFSGFSRDVLNPYRSGLSRPAAR